MKKWIRGGPPRQQTGAGGGEREGEKEERRREGEKEERGRRGGCGENANTAGERGSEEERSRERRVF